MPERFDAFMARANTTYYARGAFTADFATAPEMTQVFGELLGAWAKTVWQMMGAPPDMILVEAGPGRGTLMQAALRAWPEMRNVHLIETAPALRAEQERRIPFAVWHDSLQTIPAGPMILLANEFLDALPVRVFVRRAAGWMERFVEDGVYVELPTSRDLPDDPPGSVREVADAAIDFCKSVAARGAVALIIDYGPSASAAGESVQAIRHGAYADPLTAPGQADITAHVDFSAIARAVNCQGPVKQNAFLTSLGLFERTDFLARRNPGQAQALRAAAQRLTAPEAMGSLFKMCAICPPELAPLPGFSA
jgi:SAM-dependent MidA family methyltransferase